MSEFSAAPTSAPRAELPLWPVYLLFAGYPGFWLLGLGAFATAICAVPMLVLLWLRGGTVVPRAFGLWVLFVLWVVAAALMVDDSIRLVGVVLRWSNYVAVGVLFVYVANAVRLTNKRAFALLGVFLAAVVVGGWLGVLLPDVRLHTPTGALLPSSLMHNEYVRDLVDPAFAEVQRPYGAPRAFDRPSAPFPYTNSWGVNAALLVPLALAGVAVLGRRARAALVVLLVAGSVPALATLNRGMFLAVGLGVFWAALQMAFRRRLVPLLWVLTVTSACAVGAVASGALDAVRERLSYSGTTQGRLSIYGEALRGAFESPLFGNGSPRPSATSTVSVGTQGQIWNVMYSYGFLALLFFVAWFVAIAWRSRRWSTGAELWLHVAAVVGLTTIAYYGYDGPQLAVVMVVGGLCMRPSSTIPGRSPAVDRSPALRRAPGLA